MSETGLAAEGLKYRGAIEGAAGLIGEFDDSGPRRIAARRRRPAAGPGQPIGQLHRVGEERGFEGLGGTPNHRVGGSDLETIHGTHSSERREAQACSAVEKLLLGIGRERSNRLALPQRSILIAIHPKHAVRLRGDGLADLDEPALEARFRRSIPGRTCTSDHDAQAELARRHPERLQETAIGVARTGEAGGPGDLPE